MKKYQEIVEHYERCLEKHGDTHLGVDWPKLEDVDKRYKIMLDILDSVTLTSSEISLLDFGCGTAHLKKYINDTSRENIKYSGLDISHKYVELAKKKYPDCSFYCLDILEKKVNLPSHDFVIMNGVFTEKLGLSFNEMWNYFTEMILAVFSITNKGLAFNVMSKNVDWERHDLFHLSLDLLTNFICKNMSRDFLVRSDYGLYEYTVYILKK